MSSYGNHTTNVILVLRNQWMLGGLEYNDIFKKQHILALLIVECTFTQNCSENFQQVCEFYLHCLHSSPLPF